MSQLRPHRHAFVRRSATAFCAALLVAAAVPAQAQSILRDAETEAVFDDMSAPIIRAAGLDPSNVKIVVVNSPEVNAFVAGGQIVYLHSGLIQKADDANEVQGVIAHELGHIVGGHVLRTGEGMKEAMGIMLLSMLGGLAATAAGSGDAGMAAMALGQHVAMNRFLAFSRAQEASADAAGVKFLSQAQVSGKGSVSFFRKLQNMEYRYNAGYLGDGYTRTHPLTGDRIQLLQASYEKDPAWAARTNATLEARFQRVRAKLIGFVEEPRQTLTLYPESDKSIPAHYARAFAYHKSAYPDKAAAEVSELEKRLPRDPYVLELKGQVLLESGKPAAALPPLREAVALTRAQPLIAAMFGHALIATDDKANYAEAERILKAAVARDNDNPFAWYQLGIVYAARGDETRAALATAERYALERNYELALPNAQRAMASLPKGSADYLRAQDIAMVAEAQIKRDKKKR